MNAKKCDRCKRFYMDHDRTLEIKPKYYESNSKDKPDEMSNVTVSFSFMRRYYSGKSNIGDMDMNDTLDLCPECAEKVFSVLYNSDEDSINENK